MKKTILLSLILSLAIALPTLSLGQTLTVTASDSQHVSLHFELGDFGFDTVRCQGELMQTIVTKGIVAPNEQGLPDLPTFNRFIAIPQGAKAVVEMRTTRDERMTGINIAPSMGSIAENDPVPPLAKDTKTYSINALYPETAFVVAEPQQLRGVDVIHLGLCPFQFNPVTRELAVHHEMDIEIRFEGGNGHFGDDRLRSPYWDPILQNNILNYDCLAPIDYDARRQEWSRTRATGCEYLILTPNNDAFISAAQELANYRTRQGILTNVMSIGETGATTPGLLRLWIREIYANWDIVPAAVCILADQGTDYTQFVPAFRTQSPKDGFISSDNPYADIDDDELPDICFSRLVAQNESELPIFIGKQIEYEYTNPCMNLFYYKHPLTASAWQTTLWFQLTISTIYGYLSQHGKLPTRLSEIHSGELSDQWSTASGTNTIVNYFGPNGLGYIPASPTEWTGWTGATAQDVIQAFNQGAYIVQHRDHGWSQKWYQPLIQNSDFGEINNPGQMPFMISVNCKTGQYDFSSNCFTEGLMRMTRNGQNAGIVGAISPSGQTYSFANDILVWGIWDLFDPSFLPNYGPFANHVAEWMPAFAMISGKYLLDASVFPGTNASMRATIYNAFHAHCDAFLRIFTEVPQTIQATHDNSITCFAPFHITAPEGVQIALSTEYGGKAHILATATGTGQEQTLYVMDYVPTNTVHLTMTGLNYLRHEENIHLMPINGPFVVADSVAFNDGVTHLNFQESATLDLNVRNVGSANNGAGTAVLANTTGQMQITQAQADYPALAPDESILLNDAFQITLTGDIPDGSRVPFTVTTQFDGGSFEREFDVAVVAPHIRAELVNIDDAAGNGNGYLDAGEYANLTFHLTNTGHYDAISPSIALSNNEGYARIVTPPTTLAGLPIGASTNVTFEVYIEYAAGEVPAIEFIVSATCGELVMETPIQCTIGFTNEGFESGTFNPEYWTNDPEHPWQIIDVDAIEGNYCALSDTTITHDESSRLTFTYTSNQEGNISFYCKVSSESNYDFLRFLIDEEEIQKWSGSMQWYEQTFPVTPGRHEYSWNYTKDYSVSSGSDCAWIDYITLPPYLDETEEQTVLPLTVHPNPTTDQITLDMEQEGHFTVQVFDENGRLILSEKDTQIISLKGKPAGMYHIVVTQDGQRWSRKIIKM